MMFLQLILTLPFLLLVMPLLVVKSSSLNDSSVSNITRGSSISTSFSSNTTSHWLSPSGNIAFGFYHLPCRPSSSNCTDQYVVGIWLVKSSQKTLVWTAIRNDLPLAKQSSILLTDKGKLILKIMPDNKQKPLIPDVQEPISYAVMHDNGNFILYGSESQIIWESFDHPTDTILGGQKLKDAVDLTSSVSLYNPGSGTYKLSIRQSDGLFAIYRSTPKLHTDTVISRGFRNPINSPVTLNLDSTGELYLVGSDGVVLKYLYRNKIQQQEGCGCIVKKDVHIYRAILDSRGYFKLYKERIDGNASDNKNSSSTVVPLWSSHKRSRSTAVDIIIIIGLVALYIIIRSIESCLSNRSVAPQEDATVVV